jgi:hypothetical protein
MSITALDTPTIAAPGYSAGNAAEQAQQDQRVAMPPRDAVLTDAAVSLSDVATRIVSLMLSAEHTATSSEGAQDPIGQVARKTLASPSIPSKTAAQVVKELSTRGWLGPRTAQLAEASLSSQSANSTSYLSALERTLQVAAARELIVSELAKKASTYGRELPQKIKETMFRADPEGTELFTTAVRSHESDALARELVAHCINRGAPLVNPEKANDFVTGTKKVSRHNSEEISVADTKATLKTAVAREWISATDTRKIKGFLLQKPRVGWPIMHALNALRIEQKHRDQPIKQQ